MWNNHYYLKLCPSFPLFCNFLIQSTQEAISYPTLYQAQIFWTDHKKYFLTKWSDWWVTLKHDLSNCYWISPSKLLSTQLFQTNVILLVQMSLLLKILLRPTRLFLEGNVMEPIWNSVWHVHLSQALPSLCSILPLCCEFTRTTFFCNKACQ